MSQYHSHLRVSVFDRARALRYRTLGARLGKGVIIKTGAELLRFPNNITIGSLTVVKKMAQICACNDQARVRIGEYSTIGDYSYIYSSENIEIGDRVLIAPYCYIVDGNHGIDRSNYIRDQPLLTQEIVVGDDVWLGARVVLLPGVTICTGAVVAAGSVVTKDIPKYEIWGGVPARKLKVRT